MVAEYSAANSMRRWDAVMLVRAAPATAAGAAALFDFQSRLRRTSSTMVFFHGPGVEWALPEHAFAWLEQDAGAEYALQVCQTAWQRRHDGWLPDRMSLSTLVQFWNQAMRAGEVLSYG